MEPKMKKLELSLALLAVLVTSVVASAGWAAARPPNPQSQDPSNRTVKGTITGISTSTISVIAKNLRTFTGTVAFSAVVEKNGATVAFSPIANNRLSVADDVKVRFNQNGEVIEIKAKTPDQERATGKITAIDTGAKTITVLAKGLSVTFKVDDVTTSPTFTVIKRDGAPSGLAGTNALAAGDRVHISFIVKVISQTTSQLLAIRLEARSGAG